MEYLTAAEISKHWNISNRMVAYYCESGRIIGAVKKGKVWLIPINSEKPVDRRFAGQKTQLKKNTQAEPYNGDETVDDAIYHTSDIFDSLGLTRETLRYYEEIGLIKPKRNECSQYREFDLYDMSRLLMIDFFKKRGFDTTEIRDLQKAAEPGKYSEALQKKTDDIRKKIENLNTTLSKLQKARDFLSTLDTSLNFTIKELPPYYIQETLSSSTAFGEYKDKVLSDLNTKKEDILSNMVRAMTFDENGYISSEVYIVKSNITKRHSCEETLLDYGKCLHTTLTVEIGDTSIPRKMFTLCYEWAKQHNVRFRGVVYIFTQFVMLNEQTDKYCHEIWVPLQD